MIPDAPTNAEPLDDDVAEQDSSSAEVAHDDHLDPATLESIPPVDDEPDTLPPDVIESHLASEECDELSQRCIEQLLGEVVAATEARQRALADFKNFQRRASEEEQRMTRIASANAFRSILPVLDQLQLAVQQDLETVSGEQILEGVRIAGDEMMKILSDHGVSPIEPSPGDEFQPQRHEAMMNMMSDEHETGRIVQVLQVGFILGEQVLRPAKVAVAS